MELIRRNTGYGLRALLYMAANSEHASFTAEDLAAAADSSADFMHKIMQALRDAGIVESKRGRSGGFRLAKEPREINLLEVVNALQGPLRVNRCVIGLKVCERSPRCPLRPTWMSIQQTLEEGLRGTTLADLVAVARCNSDTQ